MEQAPEKHVCGQCGDEWLTEAEYIAHTCPATQTQPSDPAHLGPEFLEIQKSALERGHERLVEDAAPAPEIERQEAAIAEVQTAIEEAQAAPEAAPEKVSSSDQAAPAEVMPAVSEAEADEPELG